MTTQEQYIERLKELVKTEFGHPIATPEDCIALSNAVLDEVGIAIDQESLEQLFLVEGSHLAPRPLMLSSLARYAGFTGWSDFCTTRDVTPSEQRATMPMVRHWGVIALSALAVIIVIISIVALVNGNNGGDEEYRSVDSRFRNVEQEWLARTTERCNELRMYYDTNDAERYNERVEKYADRYEILLQKRVKRDITDYAMRNKITVDNDTIDLTAEIIIENCLNMLQSAKIEE